MSSLYVFYWTFVIDEAVSSIKQDTEELHALYEDRNKHEERITVLHERINSNREKVKNAELKIKKYQGDDVGSSRTSGPLC